MRRSRPRFLFGFFAGTATAAAVVITTAGVSSVAATRYEDLSLFSNVLRLVRDNYVEPVDEQPGRAGGGVDVEAGRRAASFGCLLADPMDLVERALHGWRSGASVNTGKAQSSALSAPSSA